MGSIDLSKMNTFISQVEQGGDKLIKKLSKSERRVVMAMASAVKEQKPEIKFNPWQNRAVRSLEKKLGSSPDNISKASSISAKISNVFSTISKGKVREAVQNAKSSNVKPDYTSMTKEQARASVKNVQTELTSLRSTILKADSTTDLLVVGKKIDELDGKLMAIIADSNLASGAASDAELVRANTLSRASHAKFDSKNLTDIQGNSGYKDYCYAEVARLSTWASVALKYLK
ncbi:MAG: hypothetical protein LLF94_10775 [Chlamydiales bacterium]|nr:hypothetical protein [Chlamydiales bacterium]